MCGILGIYGESSVVKELFSGMESMQNRGQTSCGFLTYDGSNIFPKKTDGMVNDLFTRKELQESPDNYFGSMGIAHVRYATSGGEDTQAHKRDAQPEYITSPLFISAAHNGQIYNGQEISKTFKRKPRTKCDVQFLLLPMQRELIKENRKRGEDTTLEAVYAAAGKVMREAKGSYSAIFLTDGEDDPFLFAMTDPHKVRPLVVGKKIRDRERIWYLASETATLKRLGADYVMDVPGGSVLSVDPKNDKPVLKRIIEAKPYHCMFEWVYFSRPDSYINGVSVHDVRVRMGEALGREHSIKADSICPSVESGRRYGTGVSRVTGIPLEEGLMKDKFVRTFLLKNQGERDDAAHQSLIAVDAAVKDKRVAVTEDSLVRGTNMRKIVRILRGAGAKEVHALIGCPPIIRPCYLGIDMRSNDEFIATDENGNLRSIKDIGKDVNTDSLMYGSIKALHESIKQGRTDFDICTGCLGLEGYPPSMLQDVKEFYRKSTGEKRAYES